MTKEAQIYNGVKTVSSINGAEKIGEIHAKNETRSPTYTIHKNKLKTDKELKQKTGSHKNTRDIHRQQSVRHMLKEFLQGYCS